MEALFPSYPQTPEPVEVRQSLNREVEFWVWDMSMTRYRLMVVRMPRGEVVAAFPVDVGQSGWFYFETQGHDDLLSQDYVAEKLGIDREKWLGNDARNLTKFVGAVLDRAVLITQDRRDAGYARWDPREEAVGARRS